MGGHDGFRVDIGALEQASKGVSDAIATLEGELPFGASAMADDGRGVEGMRLGLQDTGNGELTRAVNKFLGKWISGVKFLVEEGAAIAAALNDTRSGYQKAENAASAALKEVLTSVAGDPGADLNEQSQKSWGQLAVETVPEPAQQPLSQSLNSGFDADTKAP